MSQLNLKIDKSDPDLTVFHGQYSDLKAFKILERYLEAPPEDSSIVQTTKAIHDMLLDRKETYSETQHSNFSHTVLDIAQQIPYYHPAQGRLVRLLQHLQASSKWTSKVIDEEEPQANDQSISARFEPSTPEEEQYINKNAFLARTSSSGMLRGPGYACWTLQDALEEPSSDQVYSGQIGAAAVWILCAGQWLFHEVVGCPRSITPDDERSWRGGSMYTGPVLGLERWKFWKKGLAVGAESSRCNEEFRKLAQKAASFMDAIELANTR